MEASEVIAGGGAEDFALVRHVRLAGTQAEIGASIAGLAWANHGVRPQPSADPALTRARRKWREVHWPQLEERARGVADYWGLAYDDRTEAAALPVGFGRGGCSVVWLPPQRTCSGAATLSRAFDFSTLTLNQMLGAPRHEGDEPFCGRPYVLETRPASGYATLTITAFELLAGAADGINQAGLVAAMLSDDDSTIGGGTPAGADPTFAPAVGLSEIEFCRYVLETCATAEQALEAVRVARHYYLFHPEHFVVADRSGRAFVYEFAPGHNTEHVMWADGLQVLTNHLLYRYPAIADLPPGDGNGLTYARFRTLTSLFSGAGRYTPGQIAERHAAVRFTGPDTPVRTLWYALYDTERCTMNVSFYLRDTDHGEIRTPQLAFSLPPAPAAAPAPHGAATG
jgi:Acyl-coenzyme A:6-aminopenicillanic acid acyl-transferase